MRLTKLHAVASLCVLACVPALNLSRRYSLAPRVLGVLGLPAAPSEEKPLVTEAEAEENLRRSTVTLAEAKQARWSVAKQVAPQTRSRRSFLFSFPDGDRVDFTDRPRHSGEGARRRRVVVFTGTESAAEAAEETFLEAARRTELPDQAARALQFVSQHEGGFDAVNTWDRARFSWGFIQFAGGRGFPKMLGHFKSQDPELFHEYLGQYGVDVLPDRDGDPVPVCVDTARRRVLYGNRAEQRIGDDPLLVSLFIRAGRDPEVQRLQIEAACEQYVRPALRARWSGIVLSSVLRSPKGLAMLIDRKIHEGNCLRLARALDRVQEERGFLDLAYAESLILLRAVRDTWTSGRTAVRERLHNIYYSDLPGPA